MLQNNSVVGNLPNRKIIQFYLLINNKIERVHFDTTLQMEMVDILLLSINQLISQLSDDLLANLQGYNNSFPSEEGLLQLTSKLISATRTVHCLIQHPLVIL